MPRPKNNRTAGIPGFETAAEIYAHELVATRKRLAVAYQQVTDLTVEAELLGADVVAANARAITFLDQRDHLRTLLETAEQQLKDMDGQTAEARVRAQRTMLDGLWGGIRNSNGRTTVDTRKS